MRIDLTPVFQAIIALLAALVTYKLIPWIKSKTTESQQTMMHAMYKTFVFAAEQLYGAGHGKEKLEYVKFALQDAGFDVNIDEIEAAVGEYINNGRNNKEAAAADELPPLEEWPLEMILNFVRDNGIPYDGEETKEELISAIKQEFNVAEEPEPEEEPAEEDAPGVTDAPPDAGQDAE